MQVEFKREDYNKKSNKITILVSYKMLQEISKLDKIDVKSPSGAVRTFNYNKVKTGLYAMENEGWDGEYSCILFDSLYGKEASDIIVEIGANNYE